MTVSARHPESEIDIEDLVIDGPHGDVPVRTYLPAHAHAGLVWVHGGAFCFGSMDQPESDWVARQLAARGIAIVTVDYRLAPVPEWAATATGTTVRDGVTFPVASEEISATFSWARTLLREIAPGDWSLGGASAGANLSVGAALRLRDKGHPLPNSLVLAYGLFHAALPTLRPELARKQASLPPELAPFTPEVVHLMNVNYVGNPDLLDAGYAFPGGHGLEGLPPTFLLNADNDSLRASGDQFGAELAASGVDVLVVRETDTYHGYLDDPDLPQATRSIERIASWLTSDLVHS